MLSSGNECLIIRHVYATDTHVSYLPNVGIYQGLYWRFPGSVQGFNKYNSVKDQNRSKLSNIIQMWNSAGDYYQVSPHIEIYVYV